MYVSCNMVHVVDVGVHLVVDVVYIWLFSIVCLLRMNPVDSKTKVEEKKKVR